MSIFYPRAAAPGAPVSEKERQASARRARENADAEKRQKADEQAARDRDREEAAQARREQEAARKREEAEVREARRRGVLLNKKLQDVEKENSARDAAAKLEQARMDRTRAKARAEDSERAARLLALRKKFESDMQESRNNQAKRNKNVEELKHLRAESAKLSSQLAKLQSESAVAAERLAQAQEQATHHLVNRLASEAEKAIFEAEAMRKDALATTLRETLDKALAEKEALEADIRSKGSEIDSMSGAVRAAHAKREAEYEQHKREVSELMDNAMRERERLASELREHSAKESPDLSSELQQRIKSLEDELETLSAFRERLAKEQREQEAARLAKAAEDAEEERKRKARADADAAEAARMRRVAKARVRRQNALPALTREYLTDTLFRSKVWSIISDDETKRPSLEPLLGLDEAGRAEAIKKLEPFEHEGVFLACGGDILAHIASSDRGRNTALETAARWRVYFRPDGGETPEKRRADELQKLYESSRRIGDELVFGVKAILFVFSEDVMNEQGKKVRTETATTGERAKEHVDALLARWGVSFDEVWEPRAPPEVPVEPEEEEIDSVPARGGPPPPPPPPPPPGGWLLGGKRLFGAHTEAQRLTLGELNKAAQRLKAVTDAHLRNYTNYMKTLNNKLVSDSFYQLDTCFRSIQLVVMYENRSTARKHGDIVPIPDEHVPAPDACKALRRLTLLAPDDAESTASPNSVVKFYQRSNIRKMGNTLDDRKQATELFKALPPTAPIAEIDELDACIQGRTSDRRSKFAKEPGDWRSREWATKKEACKAGDDPALEKVCGLGAPKVTAPKVADLSKLKSVKTPSDLARQIAEGNAMALNGTKVEMLHNNNKETWFPKN